MFMPVAARLAMKASTVSAKRTCGSSGAFDAPYTTCPARSASAKRPWIIGDFVCPIGLPMTA